MFSLCNKSDFRNGAPVLRCAVAPFKRVRVFGYFNIWRKIGIFLAQFKFVL